jgi:hypothetical protein
MSKYKLSMTQHRDKSIMSISKHEKYLKANFVWFKISESSKLNLCLCYFFTSQFSSSFFSETHSKLSQLFLSIYQELEKLFVLCLFCCLSLYTFTRFQLQLLLLYIFSFIHLFFPVTNFLELFLHKKTTRRNKK